MPSDVVMVNGAAELSARAGHLFGSATQEIVCVARDLHTFAATRSSDETALARRVSAGLVVRKLFMSEALLDPESAASIERLDRAGAEVRITSVPVNQTIVIDRRVAILAGDPVPGDARTYSIVTDPGVIDGLLSLYRVAWQGATELAVAAVDLADVRAVAPADPRCAALGRDRRVGGPGARHVGADLSPPGRVADGGDRGGVAVPGRCPGPGSRARLIPVDGSGCRIRFDGSG